MRGHRLGHPIAAPRADPPSPLESPENNAPGNTSTASTSRACGSGHVRVRVAA
ncbi:hypothetical protein UO65_0365 [Actinokineospora spheciospongiae]|uniref:Uncharacterized protein n=1 Tax=Actinokineospora spheciospongiae TaxID=909613 RepID=W7J5D1_9PSEU|nr:hypothetical protein UO65_0365 [Actinokineospora spheciospongiae]